MEPAVDVAFRVIFEKAAARCLVLAPDAPRFGVLAASDTWLRLAGVERSQAVGVGLFELLAQSPLDADQNQLREALSRAVASRRPTNTLIARETPPSSAERPTRQRARVEFTPVLSDGGELLYILHTIECVDGAPGEPDEAARASALERELDNRSRDLQNALAELEAFSYSVSHDLRAPLRAIDGFSQALAHDYGAVLDTQGHHYIERVRSGAQRMSALIDDLLELSRIQRAPLRRSRVDVTALAERIAEGLTRGNPDRKAVIDIAPGLIVHADPHLLGVVLEKLLANAWKFTSRKPEAHIRVGQELALGAPALFVADNGAGFDMAYASRLFSPFQRLHKASDFEGTGIGLAIAHRVLCRHGGRIWADADPGEGAKFSFSLGAEDE